MGRKRDMRSKIYKLKQNVRKRWKDKRAKDDKFSNNFVQPVAMKSSLSHHLTKYLTIIENIFDPNSYRKNCELPYTETITQERAQRMSASNLYRILSWKQTSLSIFDKILGSQTFAPQSNNYEVELNEDLSSFHQMLEDNGITGFNILNGPFFYDIERPYLCGTPDFAVTNKDNSTILVIEAKEIKEESELHRHFSHLTQDIYKLRNSSEYYHQLRAYIIIFKAEFGMLLAKTKLDYFYVLVAKSEFSADELKKLKQFYTQFFLPMKILNRKPQLTDGVANYGHEFSFNHLHDSFQNEDCWLKLIKSFDVCSISCNENIPIR